VTRPGTELLVHREDHDWIGYREQEAWEVMLAAPDSGGGFRYIMCRIWIYDRARYMTGPALAWQLNDNDTSERLGRVGVAGQGGEFGEHLDGRRHHKCRIVAVRAC